MSPVCRNETLAGLKIKKRIWGKTCLRVYHALFNKFLIKNNIIRNIAVADNILCRRIFIFTTFFCVK